MKKFVLILTLVFLALFTSVTFSNEVKKESQYYSIAENMVDDSFAGLRKRFKASKNEDLLNKTIIPNVGKNYDFLGFYLLKYDKSLDSKRFVDALYKTLDTNQTPIVRERTLYILSNLDDRFDYKKYDKEVDELTGKMGIMSIVYGLKLYDMGFKSDKTRDQIEAKFESFKIGDGYGLSKEHGLDPDISFMVIESIGKCDDAAYEKIMNIGKSNDGYVSLGNENLESYIQNLNMRYKLGKEITKKDFDYISNYKLENNGFMHIKKVKAINLEATIQAISFLLKYMEVVR